VLTFTSTDQLELRSHGGQILRVFDFTGKGMVEIIIVDNNRHIVIKNPAEYDCALEFSSSYLKDTFLKIFEKRFAQIF